MSAVHPSPILTGCDRLLRAPKRVADRTTALLAHGAAVTADGRPIHLALQQAGAAPHVLFAPEHGYYGVEQDMIPGREQRDPWTDIPIRSLYGEDEGSLHPDPSAFDDIDLLLIDLQDVGSRYYTYVATAVWATEVALAAGVEVWVLDRPNPLGGEHIEGNRLPTAFNSFVGAFPIPVRHGLTIGELFRFEAARRGWDRAGLTVWAMAGWRRAMTWSDLERPWIAPSPNMPTYATAVLYPGGCLLEATTASEGRGTTRPFQLIGAPWIDDPPALAADVRRALDRSGGEDVVALPTYFRPQFQKHAGLRCGGVELVAPPRVARAAGLAAYRFGVHLLACLRDASQRAAAVDGSGDVDWGWRREPYEFVTDRPAIDLLTGDPRVRAQLDAGVAGNDIVAAVEDDWRRDERAFRDAREPHLLYPSTRHEIR
ncbi:MAG: DUF1343 domain-containing protein [Acidobacteriota bacterium]